MALTLVIGNKNYSSWSLRAWMLLQHLGLEFEELVLPLYTPAFAGEIRRYSPAGRVPVLLDGKLHVWDTLAIAEYLAEKTGRGWPADRAARARARSLSAEMHSGFLPLRTSCPFNARARGKRVAESPELRADIERIDDIWRETRELFGQGGPWLFGDYSIADAMYSSVVLRFRTYGIDLSAPSSTYRNTVLSDPPLLEWLRAAHAEPLRVEAIDSVGA
jgi:glutathione S-transferase